MIGFLIFIALIIGMLLPLQGGVNAQLRTYAPHPVVAALISFLVGTLTLLIVSLVMRSSFAGEWRLGSAPWWMWTGGLFGANYVLMAIILAPRLGAATLVGLTVTGQMLSSVVLDHYGLIGFPHHPISLGRIVGAVLLLIGVLLIQRF
jgi:transporter family-2 protein